MDYTAPTFMQMVSCEVETSASVWKELTGGSARIEYSAEVPFATYVGAYDADLIVGRRFRIRSHVASGFSAHTITCGMPDPSVYSGGSWGYCGYPVTRFVPEVSTVWFLGTLLEPSRYEQGEFAGLMAVEALSYMNYLHAATIEDPQGWHYGNSTVLTIQSGIREYELSEIDTSFTDVYRVDIGTSASVATITKENEAWTYRPGTKQLVFLKDIPVSAYVLVYGHVEVDIKTVFDAICVQCGVPAYSGTSLAGIPLTKVWFPQGWSYRAALQNLGEQRYFRLFVTHEGTVTFAPRPLNTTAATVTWNDGAQVTYRLLDSVDRTILQKDTSKVTVTGATWKSVAYTANDYVIADHSDGSSVNNWGGTIEVVSDSTANILSPARGEFSASTERNDRVAKLTGTLIDGSAGYAWWFNKNQAAVDMSAYTGIQLTLRGNGQALVLMIWDSNNHYSMYDFGKVHSYTATLHEIPFSLFYGDADLTALTRLEVRQFSKGAIDFACDSIKGYPKTVGNSTRQQETEFTVEASYGVDGGHVDSIGFTCCASQEECSSIAQARYTRAVADRSEVACVLHRALDPTLEPNLIVAITTTKYSWTAEKFEIDSFDIDIDPVSQMTFRANLVSPLTSTQKSSSGNATLNTAFVAVQNTSRADVSDQTVLAYFNHNVDGITSESPWNAEVIVPHGFELIQGQTAGYPVSNYLTLVFTAGVASSWWWVYRCLEIARIVDKLLSGVASVTTSTVVLTFSTGVETTGAGNIANAEIIDVSGVSLYTGVAAVSAQTITLTFRNAVVETTGAANLRSIEILNFDGTTAWEAA